MNQESEIILPDNNTKERPPLHVGILQLHDDGWWLPEPTLKWAREMVAKDRATSLPSQSS